MRVTVNLHHDQDCPNPMTDCDGQWTLHSFGRRHVNYTNPEALGLSLERDADGYPKVRNPGLRTKLKVGLAFFVSYFEHGQCMWFMPGCGPTCPWDSVKCAGLLVWDHKPSDLGAKTYQERQKDAASFLEEYTHWCNGECYGFQVEDQEGGDLGGCCGFIGSADTLDYMFDEIRACIPEGAEAEVAGEASFLADYKDLKPTKRA
jgi:hypothetical protein